MWLVVETTYLRELSKIQAMERRSPDDIHRAPEAKQTSIFLRGQSNIGAEVPLEGALAPPQRLVQRTNRQLAV